MSGEPVALLAALTLVALVLAAALSAGEAAVLRVTRAAVLQAVGGRGAPERGTERDHEAERRADPQAPGPRRALALLADPAATARSVGFVRVVAEIVAITCLTLLVAAWLEPWWQILLVALALSVVVGLVVVRVSPRSLGRRHAVRVLLALAGLMTAVVGATRWLTRLAPAPDAGAHERELQDMVDRVNESRVIEEEERELIRSVFELGSTLTREVMVPRTDMVTTSRDVPLRKVLSLFLRSGFSRVPVTGVSADDLVGVAYFKDVVRVLQGATDPDLPVGGVARPAVFVPESKPVDDLLREMQASMSHIAMVVDEYGGIAGLVTIEDALEEIVGELTDEHDRPEPEVEDVGDGRLRVPARLGVDELGELFDLDLDDDDVDTAGGLLAKALGKVPLPGSSAQVHGLRLEADRVQGRRKQLATLLVGRAAAEDDAPDRGPSRSAGRAPTTDPALPTVKDPP
ncbi:hemolysin family protein [Cellulosimicrobium marinum]|uniref:hemolysin family protein n=1 Tax=Cellulosimicrobium marinum TaxID=1638992 RepID=UPI001E5A6E1F|nr:CBS domain-containing protein [Cellulosimicrobium marinum]MCB7135413.1 CBS domain-containing protein [Cellulosimicrobium marinum]